MSSTEFSTLLKDVLPSARGCPIPVAIDMLRDSARELCECAAIWRGEIDQIMYVAGVPEYEIVAPDDTEIVQVLEVYQAGYGAILPKTSADLARADTLWRERVSRQPASFVHPAVDMIRLVGIPEISATAPLVVTGWLQPSLSAVSMDGKILSKWRDHIVVGAKAKLLSMGDVPWTNPALASYHAAKFYESKARAKGASLSQFAGARLSVATRPLGG